MLCWCQQSDRPGRNLTTDRTQITQRNSLYNSWAEATIHQRNHPSRRGISKAAPTWKDPLKLTSEIYTPRRMRMLSVSTGCQATHHPPYCPSTYPRRRITISRYHIIPRVAPPQPYSSSAPLFLDCPAASFFDIFPADPSNPTLTGGISFGRTLCACVL